MKIYIDTHTHSVASGHAYSTVDELAKGARRRGLSGFVLTDHGPALPGGTHPYHFGNLRVLPPQIHGVRFYSGVEANILSLQGNIEMEAYLLKRLDFVMAGFHEICFENQGVEGNTQAMVSALANPAVDAISHPGNPAFPIDLEAVVRAAKEYGKALEINDSSFRIRKGSEKNCATITQLCVDQGTLMVVGSDAHYWRDVGRFGNVQALLKKVGVPKHLVINSSVSSFETFIAQRREARQNLS